MNIMDTFMTNAKGLAKNPLGIIALFISLIYGFACLVLGISGKSLVHEEKMPFIWFLIFFPVLILVTFVYLVTRHHQKLYAPSDFRDDSGFLSTMDLKRQAERLDAKTNELTLELIQNPTTTTTTTTNINGSTESIDVKPLDEVNSRNYDRNESIKSKYLLVENLVFSVLESEFNTPLIRSVASNQFYFDGMIELPTEILAFEVKYTPIGRLKKDVVLSKALRHIESVKKNFAPKKLRFILVVVHEGKNLDKLMTDISEIVENSNNQIEYRLYDLNELLKRFETVI